MESPKHRMGLASIRMAIPAQLREVEKLLDLINCPLGFRIIERCKIRMGIWSVQVS